MDAFGDRGDLKNAEGVNQALESGDKMEDCGGAASSSKQGRVPRNPQHFDTLAGKFGGPFTSQKSHVRSLAATHLQGYPGDWEMGISIKHKGILSRFLKKQNPSTEEMDRVFRLIQFRDSCAQLADDMVEAFGWTRPYGQICKDWDKRSVLKDGLECRKGTIFRIMLDEQFHIEVIPWTAKGVAFNFNRPTYYIAACLAITELDFDAIRALQTDLKAWRKLVTEEEVSSSKIALEEA